jgi:hypothetical protein
LPSFHPYLADLNELRFRKASRIDHLETTNGAFDSNMCARDSEFRKQSINTTTDIIINLNKWFNEKVHQPKADPSIA